MDWIIAGMIEGELLKKGQRAGVGDSWHQRHFTYEPATGVIRYYKGAPPEGALKGEVVVRGVDPREDLQGTRRHKPNRFDFILVDDTGRRPVLAVSAADAATRQRWINAVNAKPSTEESSCARKDVVILKTRDTSKYAVGQNVNSHTDHDLSGTVETIDPSAGSITVRLPRARA